MSTATPAASTPEATSPTSVLPLDAAANISAADKLVLEYLRARGHKDAEKAMLEAVPDLSQPSGTTASSTTIAADELVKKLAVYAQKQSRPGENALKDPSAVLQQLAKMGNPGSIQTLLSSISSIGAEEILSLDPTDKQEGYRELEAWVEGSLDMYRVCLTGSINCRGC